MSRSGSHGNEIRSRHSVHHSSRNGERDQRVADRTHAGGLVAQVGLVGVQHREDQHQDERSPWRTRWRSSRTVGVAVRSTTASVTCAPSGRAPLEGRVPSSVAAAASPRGFAALAGRVDLDLQGRVLDAVDLAQRGLRTRPARPAASAPTPVTRCAVATFIPEVSVHAWRSCTSATPATPSRSRTTASRSSPSGACWPRTARTSRPSKSGPHRDEDADRDGDRGVPLRRAGEADEEPGGDHADAAGGVGHHLEVGALDVDRLLRAAAQQRQADQVDDEADGTDDQHRDRRTPRRPRRVGARPPRRRTH